MIRRVSILILLSLPFSQIVLAYTPYTQKWGNIDVSSDVLSQDTFALITNGQKIIYQVLAQGENGLVIQRSLQRSSSPEKHFIALHAQNFFVSKNCLFITTTSQGEKEEPFGFYVIRLVDLHYHGFRSPIPFFFIPTNHSLGKIKSLVVKSDLEKKETEILLETSDPKRKIVKMDYEEVRYTMLGQLLLTTASNGEFSHPEFIELFSSTQKNIGSLYRDLFSELKDKGEKWVPKELKTFSPETATVQEISDILGKLDNELMELKLKYTEKLTDILLSFDVRLNAFLEKVDLTFNISTEEMKTFSLIQETPLETPLSKETRLKRDTKTAYHILLGAATVVVFTRFALPKLMKKPFSDVVTDFSMNKQNAINASWIRALVRKISPELLKKENWLSKLLWELSPQELKYAGITATREHYYRSIAQVSGNTLTFIASEFLFSQRPWRMRAGEKGSEAAIFIDEPFDEMHTVWIQKNILYNILSNQMVWPLGNIPALALMDAKQPLPTPKPGVIKTWLSGMGKAMGISLKNIPGSRIAKEAWQQWVYGLESSFYTSLIMQNTFRGGFNFTLWSFNRLVSLALYIPIYNVSYSFAKERFKIDTSNRRQFLFGVAYGMITSPIYSYLLHYGYEQQFSKTDFDLEFKPLRFLWGPRDFEDEKNN